MPYLPLKIPVEELTVGRLADFLARACSAGAVEDQPIGVEAKDAQGAQIAATEIFIEIDR